MRLCEYLYLCDVQMQRLAKAVKICNDKCRALVREERRADIDTAKAIEVFSERLVTMQDLFFFESYRKMSFAERDASLKKAREQLAKRESSTR